MTILGDQIQTIAEQTRDVLSFLPKIFGKDVHCIHLDKSYRSTSEIMEFAGRLTGEQNIQTVVRHGEAPKIMHAKTKSEMYAQIAQDFMQDADADTIAVLCLDACHAKETAAELKKTEPGQSVRHLTKDSMKFEKGISVLPFYLAKGLEFDVVCVPDLQNYITPLHRQALYINVTRALHLLRLYEIK